jgi:hypothetical protein
LNPDKFWGQCFPFKCFNTLTVVEVKGFKGTRNELRFLHYLLCYGCVLEHLYITISKEGEANGGNVDEVYLQRAQGLQKVQKASPNLQISIY